MLAAGQVVLLGAKRLAFLDVLEANLAAVVRASGAAAADGDAVVLAARAGLLLLAEDDEVPEHRPGSEADRGPGDRELDEDRAAGGDAALLAEEDVEAG